jgi:putative transposase
LWNGRRRRLSLCSISFANQRGQIGFSVLPWRWIVERIFAWLGNYCRLARDYEINPRTSEAWIKIAMIHLMVRRLA